MPGQCHHIYGTIWLTHQKLAWGSYLKAAESTYTGHTVGLIPVGAADGRNLPRNKDDRIRDRAVGRWSIGLYDGRLIEGTIQAVSATSGCCSKQGFTSGNNDTPSGTRQQPGILVPLLHLFRDTHVWLI